MGSLNPSHEAVMSSKGVDYEGILTPDSEDVCGMCWDFQQDVSISNGVYTLC